MRDKRVGPALRSFRFIAVQLTAALMYINFLGIYHLRRFLARQNSQTKRILGWALGTYSTIYMHPVYLSRIPAYLILHYSLLYIRISAQDTPFISLKYLRRPRNAARVGAEKHRCHGNGVSLAFDPPEMHQLACSQVACVHTRKGLDVERDDGRRICGGRPYNNKGKWHCKW